MKTEADFNRLKKLLRNCLDKEGISQDVDIKEYTYDARKGTCGPNRARAQALKCLERIPKHPTYTARLLVDQSVDVAHRIEVSGRIVFCAGTKQQRRKAPLVICEVT